jgi:cytochrome b561
MQWRNTADRYGFVAQSLHWVIAAGIIVQYLLAEAAEDNDAVGPLSATGIHAALGMAILVLACVRLLWRLIELPPEHPPAMRSYQHALARITHAVFYALLFAIPLTGWALATADGQSVSFFGWFDLPDFLPVSSLSKDQLEELHEVLFNSLAGLAVLHIAAALKHRFIDRDNVLRSMLPWR